MAQRDTWTISHVSNRTNTNTKEKTYTLASLETLFTTPTVSIEKDGPGFCPCTFNPKKRKNDNVQSLSMLVIDYDHDADWERDLALWAKLQCIFFAYTTHSHMRIVGTHKTPEPCFRIVIPLDKDIPSQQFPALWTWAMNHAQWKGDTSCKDQSRFYYLPTAHPDAEFECYVNQGALLSWEDKICESIGEVEVLRYENYENEGEEPLLSSTEQQHRTPAASEAWFVKDTILARARKMIVESADGNKHETLLKAACLVGGYVGSGNINREEATDQLTIYISEKPNIVSMPAALNTIKRGLDYGMKRPLIWDHTAINQRKEKAIAKYLKEADETYIQSVDAPNAETAAQKIASGELSEKERILQWVSSSFGIRVKNFLAYNSEEPVFRCLCIDNKGQEVAVVIPGVDSLWNFESVQKSFCKSRVILPDIPNKQWKYMRSALLSIMEEGMTVEEETTATDITLTCIAKLFNSNRKTLPRINQSEVCDDESKKVDTTNTISFLSGDARGLIDGDYFVFKAMTLYEDLAPAFAKEIKSVKNITVRLKEAGCIHQRLVCRDGNIVHQGNTWRIKITCIMSMKINDGIPLP